MKKPGIISLALFLIFLSCNGNDKPDVSGIDVNIPVSRFDKDFFSLDTNNLQTGLMSLEKKYPGFVSIFIQNILGIEGNYTGGVAAFIRNNKSVYDSVAKTYPETSDLKKDLDQAFKYVKFYFPEYKEPKIYTVVGPLDALAQTTSGEQTPNFLGPDFLGISLQFYLGKNFSLYQHEFFITQLQIPLYRSRRFEKAYIVPDVMKIITDDIAPEKRGGGLVEQMIEKGKQWWLLSHFIPDAHDSLVTGYTGKQIEWAELNEGLIWNHVIQNENLESKDPVVLQTYLGEGPFTQGMPESSPGNIGQWVGWQIVKKFADKNDDLSPAEIMKLPARKILEDAKYKPK